MNQINFFLPMIPPNTVRARRPKMRDDPYLPIHHDLKKLVIVLKIADLLFLRKNIPSGVRFC
jgi:hypothetical protein